MLLALYACTNNNHKTTRYQDPIAKRTSAKNVPASELTSSPTFPVGKGFPRAQDTSGGEWKESSDKEVTITWTQT